MSTEDSILKEILDEYATLLGLDLGVVDDDKVRPMGSLYFGIIVGDEIADLGPHMLRMQQTSSEGGETYGVTLHGEDKQTVQELLSRFIQIAERFNDDKGSTDHTVKTYPEAGYDQMYPSVDNVMWDAYRGDNRPRNAYFRTMSFNVRCSLNNIDIY